MKKEKVDYKIYGISLGKFYAETCDSCGETFFDEEESSRMTKIAKEKGLWGLESQSKIGKSGDGLIIRVNKKLAKFLELKEGEEITLTPENKKKLIVEI